MKAAKMGVKNTVKNTEWVPRVEGLSMNVHEVHVDALRAVCPGVFSDGKVDFDKLATALAGHVADEGQERYGLSWAGKPKCFAEIAKQTTGTLVPIRDESINFDTSENIFIEGENLEVLKILQRSYYGKVKMIYIDPPYNTGKDFVYHDSFQRSDAEEKEDGGELDESGYMKEAYKQNSKDSGRYHSNWLNMMYPRLYLARNLLRDDGVIFISIDDNEVHNLRMLMNEIFGEENFVGEFIWRKKEGGGQTDDYFVTEHEFVMVYAKSENFKWMDEIVPVEESKFNKEDEKGKFTAVKLAKWGNTARKEDRPSMHFSIASPDGKNIYPIAPDGNAGRWRVGKARMKILFENNLVFWDEKNGQNIPYEKIYYVENEVKNIKDRSILFDLATTGHGTNVLTEIFGKKDLFENPKPVELVHFFARNNTNSDDIILDFFAGSGTTAHAVMELNKEDGGNRKFICVQIPEETPEGSEARKAGYATIADITKARIRKVLERIQRQSLDTNSQRLPLDTADTSLERIQGVPLDTMQQEPEERLLLQGSTLNADSQGRTLAVPQRIQGVPLDAGAASFGFKVFKTAASNFNIWRTREFASGEELQAALVDHIKEVKQATPENKLYEILIKAGYDLNTKIERKNVSKETPSKAKESPLKHEGEYFVVNNGALIVCLSEYMDKSIVDAIIAENPKQVISLDSAFTGKDELKVNMYLSLRNKKIEFSVV